MEQYIRDKYERKLFMNPASGRTSAGPMPLRAQSIRSPFEAIPVQPVAYSKQLAQLKDMGFNNKEKNAEILKATNGDLQMSIDRLTSRAEQETAPSKPVYEDLLGAGFGKLSVTKPSQRDNDWSDLEFPAESEDEPEVKPSFEPTSITVPSTLAQTSFDDDDVEEIVTKKEPVAQQQPGTASNPWTSPALNVANVFNFDSSSPKNEDYDPFSDLTHNPFK